MNAFPTISLATPTPQGTSDAHKLYMRTTYNTTNDEVCKLETTTDKVREQEFFKWMQVRWYYGT